MAIKQIDRIFVEKISSFFAACPHGYQKEIAEKIGVEPSFLNNVIHGRRGSTEEVRRNICEAIGVGDYEKWMFGDIKQVATGSGTSVQSAGANNVTTVNTIAEEADEELEEFLNLYRGYGSKEYLRQCVERLRQIKSVTNGK